MPFHQSLYHDMSKLVIFVALVGTVLPVILSLRLRSPKCKELSRDCGESCLCGLQTCIVKEKCCYFGGKCHTTIRKEQVCCSFHCENGGTRAMLRGKRSLTRNDVRPGCEVPPPVCECPVGFKGTCCEEQDPCAFVDCDDGSVCKTEQVVCVKAPCPPTVVCVSRNKTGSCPALRNHRLPGLNAVCVDDSDCPGEEKCCSTGPSSICIDPADEESVDSPLDPCAVVLCAPGTVCKSKVNPCLIPPCPVSTQCVPIEEPQNPCASTLCPVGTVCKEKVHPCLIPPCPVSAQCVKVKRGVCPLFPGLITTCVMGPNNCLKDSACQGGQICCSRGCGKECVNPLPSGTRGCDRVVCAKGLVCRKQDNTHCAKKRCQRTFDCVPEATMKTGLSGTTTNSSVVATTASYSDVQ